MLEPKKILELLDLKLDKDDFTEDELKAAHEKTWISRSLAAEDPEINKKIVGKRVGAIETELNRNFKNLGIEFTAEEIKDKKIEDLIILGSEKITKTIADLKDKATHGNDKKLNDLTAEIETWKKKSSDLETFKTTLETDLSNEKKERETIIKNYKLGEKKKDLFGKVPFSDAADELRMKGFNLHLNENYIFDLDEKDEVIVKDKTGNQLKNEKNSGFMTPDELLLGEAKKFNLLKNNNVNNQGGGFNMNQNNNSGGNSQNNNNNNGAASRRIHPSAAANVQS